MGKNREPEDSMSYRQEKIGGVGYPGLHPSTSQADIMKEKANEPAMYGIDPEDLKRLITRDQPAVWVERLAGDTVAYEIQNIPNDQVMRICKDILPKALELYMKKSKDYGGNVMSRAPGGDLGPKACIPDMQRKFGKLVDAIWWEKPLQFEQPAEILMDLLGHILIILDEMDSKDGSESVGRSLD
jgi:hypothetical protein